MGNQSSASNPSRVSDEEKTNISRNFIHNIIDANRHLIVFIGPTNVGKRTTIRALIHNNSLKEGKRVLEVEDDFSQQITLGLDFQVIRFKYFSSSYKNEFNRKEPNLFAIIILPTCLQGSDVIRPAQLHPLYEILMKDASAIFFFLDWQCGQFLDSESIKMGIPVSRYNLWSEINNAHHFPFLIHEDFSKNEKFSRHYQNSNRFHYRKNLRKNSIKELERLNILSKEEMEKILKDLPEGGCFGSRTYEEDVYPIPDAKFFPSCPFFISPVGDSDGNTLPLGFCSQLYSKSSRLIDEIKWISQFVMNRSKEEYCNRSSNSRKKIHFQLWLTCDTISLAVSDWVAINSSPETLPSKELLMSPVSIVQKIVEEKRLVWNDSGSEKINNGDIQEVVFSNLQKIGWNNGRTASKNDDIDFKSFFDEVRCVWLLNPERDRLLGPPDQETKVSSAKTISSNQCNSEGGVVVRGIDLIEMLTTIVETNRKIQ